MNITDVMRTGRKFRRTSDRDTWFVVDGQRVYCERNGTRVIEKYSFNVAELTAQDWEPEPMILELSAQDLFDAAKAITTHNPSINNRRLSLAESAKLIADQLGLTA